MSTNQDSLVADDDPQDGNAPLAGVKNNASAPEDLADNTAHQEGSASPKKRGPYRSRVQDERKLNTQAAQFDDSKNTNPFNFAKQDLPPLDGHEQVFVCYKVHGESNFDQVLDYLQRGFTARTKDTVPEGFRVFSMKMEMYGEDLGNVVCNRDRILMTRPLALGARERSKEKALNEEIMQQIMGGAKELEEVGATAEIQRMEVGDYNPSNGKFSFPVGF